MPEEGKVLSFVHTPSEESTDEEINNYEQGVHVVDGVTPNNIPADRVIKGAFNELDEVVIMGWGKDGKEYFASSIASGPEVIWLVERCKKKLLDYPDKDEWDDD